MGNYSNIRVLEPEDLSGVSENFKVKMEQMGMVPYEKDGRVKWGNKSQVTYLKSLDTNTGRKIVKMIDNNQLPPSLRRNKGKFAKALSKISVQYYVLIVLSILLGFLYLYLNYLA